MAPALWLGRGHPSNRWISVDRYDLMRDCKICVDNLFVFTLARNPNRQKRTRVIARTMGEDFAVPEQCHLRLNDCREPLLWSRTSGALRLCSRNILPLQTRNKRSSSYFADIS